MRKEYLGKGLSQQSQLPQKLLVTDRRSSRQLAPLLEQALDVFADEVRFQVDVIADLLEAEGRDLRGVGNDGDAEAAVGDIVDRQADPLHGDGTLGNAIAQDALRRIDRQQQRVALLLAAPQRADAIDMSGDEMAAQPLLDLHGALEIHRSAGRESSQRRHAERFRGDIDGKIPLSTIGDGQAGPVDADACADREIVHDGRRQNAQPHAGDASGQRFYRAHFFDDAGKH